MELNLRGRSFLVAGASRGIGRAIATTLLIEGASVCVTGRGAADLDSVERELSVFGSVIACCGDLGDSRHVSDVYAAILAQWGRLDGLVANVGSGAGSVGWEQSQDEWQRALQQNLLTSVMLSRAAVPHLRRDGGSIVLVSSIAGREATNAPLPYGAAKAALLNYGKNLARELAPERIRVNSIAPGNILFNDGSWDRRLKAEPEATRRAISDGVPLARFGTPDEIANLATFLCSDRAAFVTGSCFVADGGQTKSI